MPLKKRMFRWNMMILFGALFSLMAIVIFVLAVFEDSFEKNMNSLSQARLEGHVGQIAGLLENPESEDWELLGREVENAGYETAWVKNGSIVQGSVSEKMKKLSRLLGEEELSQTELEIFYRQEETIFVKYDPGRDMYFTAASFSEGEWWSEVLEPYISTFLSVFVAVGVGAILLLLLLASFFTGRMNRKIMEPLEKLLKGVRRIQEGNLEEPIQYRGEEEFEKLCQTFNEMQSTILEDREQRIRTEKARTDMVTGISHDLRTPLTSIQGYIKGVLDGIANTEEKKQLYLTTAYESTEEMNILLQKLFDFSRMESGQMSFHMVQEDLAEYTAVYMAQKGGGLDSSQVELSFEMPGEPVPEILMDVDQIRRIYDNLLENSRKYAGIRPVRIRVKMKTEGKYLVVRWKDNGQGVPPEKIDKIFQRFYRCDESRKEKGSGVGLYVVQYIMKQHGGWAAARNAEGLEIELYFPRRT